MKSLFFYRFRPCLLWSLLVLLLPSFHSHATDSRRLTKGWEYYQGDLGGLWEVWRGSKASHNVVWTPVELPHCFNARDAVDPDRAYYQGPGWYRVWLDIENPYPNGHTLLHFEGAGQKARVFVYLGAVGQEHIGGYDEFTVDITDAAAKALQDPSCKGRVPIAIRCDNSRDLQMMPSDLSDFTLYGGLYRPVHLVYVPAVSLQRVHVQSTARPDGPASVTIRGRLYNPDASQADLKISIEVRDPAGQVIHTTTRELEPWTGEQDLDAFQVPAPHLWSPADPALYRSSVLLRSAAGEQRLDEPFGLRFFEFVDHGPFKLNGRRLLLRGTHYHEDHAGVGAAVPDGVVRKTFTMIKEMGANFVRLSHYQQRPLVLKMCDELGLLVWEEIPWCRGGVGGARYRQQGHDMLQAMIDQHENHPAVILWGLGNEDDWPGDFPTFDKDQIRAYMSELNDQAHQLDPSRMTTIRRCDFCKDIPDVYSPSIWAGWYRGQYTEYRASVEKELKQVDHFFHAEWGGDSHALRHSEDPDKVLAKVATGQGTDERGLDYLLKGGVARVSRDGDWSESYICNLFDWHLKEQETMPWLTGSAQWIFKDFATPLRPENPVPRVNQKGLVERDLTPKEGYYVFQSYWARKPMIHIYGHTWPIRWGTPGEEKMVKVYSNCSEAQLFLNGRPLGVKHRDSRNFPAAGLRWMTSFREGANTLKAVGHKDGKEVADEISFGYQTQPWSKPDRLVLEELPRHGDVATVQARLLDAHDVQCLDARHVVRFGLTGDGCLLDDLGTSTGSRVVELYNGRARISLVSTGTQAIVSVASPGVPTAFLAVKNTPAASTAAAGSPVDVAAIDRDRILKAAREALQQEPVSITRFVSKLSEGGPHDFYSNGDYWWPDPSKPDGLPFIRRDGQSNPENFSQHRMALKTLRDSVAALAAAYQITGEDRYVKKAVGFLRVFFLDPETRMNPNLDYAQAIPGRTPGRGIGIIDALHLIEVPRAVEAMRHSPAFPPQVLNGLKHWFGELADWMVESKNGRDEAKTKNNHAVAYFLQLAVYADFVGDQQKLAECRRQYKEVFVPDQMAPDGRFPRELSRTKPYGYSIFQLDNMATLCQVLSTPSDDLWQFQLPDGRGIRKAMAYLYPFLADKSKWPYQPDVQAWEGWPARQPCLLFAGLALDERKYLDLWKKLPADPEDPEVQRNIAITQPLLWLP